MMDSKDKRAELLRTAVAGGLILVGLTTGANPLFTALLASTATDIGGNLLGAVADRAVERWSDSWLSKSGLWHDDLHLALVDAFAHTMKKLEHEWKKDRHYKLLIYEGKHDKARLSLDLLENFSNESTKLLQQPEFTALQLPKSTHTLDERKVRQQLERALETYFEAVEPLAVFIKNHFIPTFNRSFIRIVTREKQTPAWRAFNQLWQRSITEAIDATQASIEEGNERLESLREEISKIGEMLSNQHPIPVEGSDSGTTLDQLFEHVVENQQHIERVKENTEFLISFLLERFDSLDIDSENIMCNFLQKELLSDQYVNLEQAGHHTEGEDISLAKVFVDLPISNEYLVEPPQNLGTLASIIQQLIETAENHFDPESLRLRLNNFGHQSSLVESNISQGRFVLIGGPGQGKTTVSQFICQLFRTAILRSKGAHSFRYPKVSQALNEIEEACSEEQIKFPTILRFPIRIVLNDFAAKLASDDHPEIDSVLSYIANRIRTRSKQELKISHLRSWLAQYPWLIILDGLDEVPASSNRREVLAAIDDFWIDASDLNADLLVLATTRPQGYNDDFAPNLYQHKWLSPLPPAHARHYAERLTAIRYRQDQDRQNKVLQRLNNALEDASTTRLMRSPLQITIMTALVDRIGKPPHERWSLFQKYYNVIYSREVERNIPAAMILRDYEPDIRAIHHQVGLLLQIESEHSGHTNAHLSLKRFGEIVQARLNQEEHTGQDLINLKEQIIEAATSRLVFLVEVESGKIGFEIRSFQEFMAAEGLMAGSDESVNKRLREIANVENWRNVFLFAAGKCFSERQYLRDLIRGICLDLNEGGTSDEDAFQYVLAGSKLALDLIEDGPARRQPKYAKGLMRIALRLLTLPPNPVHDRIANLYDDSLKDVFQEEFERVLQQQDVALTLGAWITLIPLVQRGVPWAKELADRAWPEDRKSQCLLADLIMEQGHLEWLLDNFSDELPQFVSVASLEESLQTLRFSDVAEWLHSTERPSWWRKFSKQVTSNYRNLNHYQLKLAEDISIESRIKLLQYGNDDGDFILPGSLEGISEDWRLMIAIDQFANHPSKSTLASILEQLAEYSPKQPFGFLRTRTPWPLASLMWFGGNFNIIDKLARLAREGQFGDVEDWKAAEKRWEQNGLSRADLEHLGKIDYPYDNNIARIGFPITPFDLALPQTILGLEQTQDILQLILPLFEDSKPSYLRTVLAESIMLALSFGERRYGFRDDSYSIPSKIGFAQFREVVKALIPERPIYLNALTSVEWTDEDREDYCALLDQLGRTGKYYLINFHPKTPSAATTLASLYSEYPTFDGILLLLSTFSEEGEKYELPSHLIPQTSSFQCEASRATVIIKLAQSHAEHMAVEDVLEIAAMPDEKAFVRRILNTIRAHQLSGRFIEALLLELLQKIPTHEWELKQSTLQLLQFSLSRRTAKLVDSWDELELPTQLKRLVVTA